MESKNFVMALSGEQTWKSFSDLRGLLNNREFSDVEITVHGETFYANSMILSQRSSYFGDIFKIATKLIVESDDVSSSSFRKILNYFYSGVFEVSADEVVELWKASISFQVDYVSRQCLDCVIANQLDGAFLEIFSIAGRKNFTDLLKWLRKCASKSIIRISERPEFQKLSSSELLLLIGNPSRSDAKIFLQAAFKWIVTKGPQDDDFYDVSFVLAKLNIHFVKPKDLKVICNRESIQDFMNKYPGLFTINPNFKQLME